MTGCCGDHEACTCGEGSSGCDCACHSGGGFRRRFQTKAERRGELEAYLVDLKAEVQAVEEILADL
jgi:hypothetical protein